MLFTPMGVGTETTTAMIERAARNWWVPLVTGIVTVGVGIVILAVDWTTEGLALVVGSIFILRGLFRVLSPAFSAAARRFDIITGVLWVIVGAAFIAWPHPTLLVLAVFIGVTLIVDGIMHFVGAVEFRHDVGTWWLEALFGVAVAAVGFLALRRPDLTLSALIVLSGLWAILMGTAEILGAFVLHHAPAELARSRQRAATVAVSETIVLGGPVTTRDEQLSLVERLHDSGGLTDAEYDRVRGRLVGSSATAGTDLPAR